MIRRLCSSVPGYKFGTQDTDPSFCFLIVQPSFFLSFPPRSLQAVLPVLRSPLCFRRGIAPELVDRSSNVSFSLLLPFGVISPWYGIRVIGNTKPVTVKVLSWWTRRRRNERDKQRVIPAEHLPRILGAESRLTKSQPTY